MKVEGRRPRLPKDSRGRLSYIFMLCCVHKEMIVGMRSILIPPNPPLEKGGTTRNCFESTPSKQGD
jgi:hypothetical protein